MKKIIFTIILASLVIISGCNSSNNDTGNHPAFTDNHIVHDSTELVIGRLFFKVGDFLMSKMYDSALMQCDSFISLLNKISIGTDSEKIALYADDISRLNAQKMSIYDSLSDPTDALTAAFESLQWSKLSNNSYLQCCDEYYIAHESKNLANRKTDHTEKKKLAEQALRYSLLAQKLMDSTHVLTSDEIHDYFHTLDSSIHSLLKD